jgi:hypothetical protein
MHERVGAKRLLFLHNDVRYQRFAFDFGRHLPEPDFGGPRIGSAGARARALARQRLIGDNVLFSAPVRQKTPRDAKGSAGERTGYG